MFVKKRFLRLEWKPQDCWVGAYWHHSMNYQRFDLWVCLLPMIPIHYEWRMWERT